MTLNDGERPIRLSGSLMIHKGTVLSYIDNAEAISIWESRIDTDEEVVICIEYDVECYVYALYKDGIPKIMIDCKTGNIEHRYPEYALVEVNTIDPNIDKDYAKIICKSADVHKTIDVIPFHSFKMFRVRNSDEIRTVKVIEYKNMGRE